ncbi:hypothetical protein [Streptomyces sp. AS02]|uniref:hypothetical protein n=1 Tax=Streptomyces sp. AS02 TaxID=2938946 RepID=UPI00201FC2B7|nr:hypothetical protein [Streptomyces sp. AS02]MCL8013486.1 hypothetical protein [Streptomyces sp. AS02]
MPWADQTVPSSDALTGAHTSSTAPAPHQRPREVYRTQPAIAARGKGRPTATLGGEVLGLPRQ